MLVCARAFVSLGGKGLVSLNGQDLPLVLDIRTQTPSLILITVTKEKDEHIVHQTVLRLTTGF